MDSTKKSNEKQKKNVNKVKVFLANPIKPKVPTLKEDEFQKLQELLIKLIKASNLTGQSFATKNSINIGLESTLRTINNCKAGCIFLSSNIKPKYLVGLIARNAEIKDEQIPIYVQSGLEDFTQNVFNVRALALVLSKDIGIKEIKFWIKAHLKPKKLKTTTKIETPIKKLKGNEAKQSVLTRDELKPNPVESEPKVEELVATKSWGGDYISFSKQVPMEVDEGKVDDSEKLLGALNQMITNVKKSKITVPAAKVDKPAINLSTQKDENTETSDEDDFLHGYAPLTLHKIGPNPLRKGKISRKERKKLKKTKIKGTKQK